MLWDWQLDEDTVDSRVVVQDIDLVDELAFSGGLGEVNEFTADASLRSWSVCDDFQFPWWGHTSSAAFSFILT